MARRPQHSRHRMERGPQRGAGGPAAWRGHWIALVAGLLAALVNIAVLRDRRNTTVVAVAVEPIEAAAPVTPRMVRWVEVPADSAVADGLVGEDGLAGTPVATRAIEAGEPLTSQALATDVPGNGLRSMSIPVAREHAAGGQLRPGDRVDVIDVVDGEPIYAVSGAEVTRWAPSGPARSTRAPARSTSSWRSMATRRCAWRRRWRTRSSRSSARQERPRRGHTTAAGRGRGRRASC